MNAKWKILQRRINFLSLSSVQPGEILKKCTHNNFFRIFAIFLHFCIFALRIFIYYPPLSEELYIKLTEHFFLLPKFFSHCQGQGKPFLISLQPTQIINPQWEPPTKTQRPAFGCSNCNPPAALWLKQRNKAKNHWMPPNVTENWQNRARTEECFMQKTPRYFNKFPKEWEQSVKWFGGRFSRLKFGPDGSKFYPPGRWSWAK